MALYRLTVPTYDSPMSRSRPGLWRFYRTPIGRTLIKTDGVWRLVTTPTVDVLNAAEAYYRGGYDNIVNRAVADDLIADGFSSFLELLTPGYVTSVLADTPEAWYRLTETAGTTAFDDSGHARHAGAGGIGSFYPNPVPGLLAGSLNGATASLGGASLQTFVYQHADGLDFLNGLTAVSVEAWVKGTGGPATVGMDSAGGATGTIAVGYPGDGDVSMVWRTDQEPAVNIIVSVPGTGWDDGQPHHMVTTADGSTLRLYQDGTPLASLAYTGTFSSGVLSAIQGGPSVLVFDEVAFYSTALSPARVAEHYEAGT